MLIIIKKQFNLWSFGWFMKFPKKASLDLQHEIYFVKRRFNCNYRKKNLQLFLVVTGSHECEWVHIDTRPKFIDKNDLIFDFNAKKFDK